MLRSDFHYDLPEALIAQFPLRDRTGSRLLCVDGINGQIRDSHFRYFPDLLVPGDLLVLNDTRVIPARLYGHKVSGGKIEILIERILDTNRALAHIKASKAPRAGTELYVEECGIRVVDKNEDLYVLELAGEGGFQALLDRVGHIPLPPYIHHADDASDRERYQTVFGHRNGAIAAPTAGLHFDQAMLERLTAQGIRVAFVTLHVGSGTFQPIRENDLERHIMHAEYCELGADAVASIEQTHAAGNKVVAVGTTVVRTLETAALGGKLEPFRGDTRLFIKPGFEFRCVDAMLTNFHLPESTLLSLVCAFAGYESVMQAYRHAVQQEYRFFSYGDSMFLTCKKTERF